MERVTILVLVAWNLLMLLVAYGYAAKADQLEKENERLRGVLK